MVRYREIVKEDIEDDIVAKLETGYDTRDVSWHDFKGDTVQISGSLYTKSDVPYLPDVKITVVTNIFAAHNTILKSLIHAPTSVAYVRMSNNPMLETLEGLPKQVSRLVQCTGTPKLKSLKGIEMDSSIPIIWIQYYPNLPLLRLLVAREKVEFSDERAGLAKEHLALGDLMTHCIETYPNLKERIYKCQYEMIKLGYKDNAKW